MKKADACGCPVIIANDPDADRLAVAEKLPRYLPVYNSVSALAKFWVWAPSE